MTDLPRAFRERLARETHLTTLVVDAVQRSSDGTRKYRLRTEDGKFIEAVYMPMGRPPTKPKVCPRRVETALAARTKVRTRA